MGPTGITERRANKAAPCRRTWRAMVTINRFDFCATSEAIAHGCASRDQKIARATDASSRQGRHVLLTAVRLAGHYTALRHYQVRLRTHLSCLNIADGPSEQQWRRGRSMHPGAVRRRICASVGCRIWLPYRFRPLPSDKKSSLDTLFR
jgi:hypothetical protein